MQDFKSFFEKNGYVALFDGAMGTEIYRRGVYINQCFENLNITRPELIKKIHEDYIEAGAEIIETNTFAANKFLLSKYGLDAITDKIIERGIQIAKEAAKGRAYVAASIGPTGRVMVPFGKAEEKEIRSIYEEVLEITVKNEPDIILFESFRNIDELKIALDLLKEKKISIPTIAQIALGENGYTAFGQSLLDLARIKEEYNLFAIGVNCGLGPAETWEFIKEFVKVYDGYLSAQPNAGYPKYIEGRLIYMATPEYFAEYAKRMIQTGVNLIGACCGSGPEHIKAIKNSILALKPGRIVVKKRIEARKTEKEIEKKKPIPAKERSKFAKKLLEGKFVVSVEIDPPRGTSFEKALKAAEELYKFGVDAINIADGPRATCRMSPFALSVIFKEQVGIEPILHYCCRDRNILAMQADLLGANALNIRNILIITGDPPKLGDYPDATAVFDVDSIGLTHIANNLNHGMDIANKPIGEPTKFFIGVGANPGAIDINKEVERFKMKVKAGAEYVLTQPVYDVKLLKEFLKRIEDVRIPVLVGILPLVSARNAEFLHNEVPGMQIPDNILNLMRKAGSGPEAVKTGIKIAKEALAEAKDMVEGVYIMPPFGRYELAMEILED